MLSAIFSSEDREFMDAVNFDLNLFIKGNNLKIVKAVLVFPPFNNFKRFLVHKIVEDSYNSVGLSTFSIGQDFQRRIIVCHSAFKLRLKALQETTKIHSSGDRDNETRVIDMIEKGVCKPRATANIYRPPAARTPASVSDYNHHDSCVKENRRSKVRRPDLQVYVPRPKRISCGEIEKSRSPPVDRRKNKCSQERRKSLDNCTSKINITDTVDLTEDDSVMPASNSTPSRDCEMPIGNSISSQSNEESRPYDRLTVECNTVVNKLSDSSSENKSACESVDKFVEINPLVLMEDSVLKTDNLMSSDVENSLKQQLSVEGTSRTVSTSPVSSISVCTNNTDLDILKEKQEILSDKSGNEPYKAEFSREDIDDNNSITMTDESQTGTSNSDDVISISSTVTESSSDDSLYSFQSSSLKRKPIKKCKLNKVCSESEKKKHETTNESSSFRLKDDEKNLNPEERNLKNRRILHGKPESDVLIISDPSESPSPKTQNELPKQDKLSGTSTLEKSQRNVKSVKEKSKTNETRPDAQSSYNPDDYEWDALFTDDGDCLVPEFMEELTKNVGRVKITTAKSDYRPFQTEEERSGDGECIVEIYDFPAEFKTNDLLNIFAAYRNRGFHIKWVDDTHALGVFGSPLVADEVLATNLPSVKTRPLRQAIPESRMKARSLALPPMERPKTCPALARRLVTGALGLRLPTASKEREAEKLVLKAAREKRRQNLKQREAMWEGGFN